MKCIFPACIFLFISIFRPELSYNQTKELIIPPAFLIPNYNRIPVGLYESVEGGASVARSAGLTAAWYNPAGIVLADFAAVSANYSGYQFLRLKLDNFEGELQSLNVDESPGLFSVVLKLPFDKTNSWSGGISLGNSTSWNPVLDSRTDLQLDNSTIETINLASKYSYSTIVPSFSIAWKADSSFRLGVSIGMPYSDLKVFQSISDQVLNEQFQEARLIDFSANGRAYQFQIKAGTQWEPSKNIVLGLTLYSPGFQFAGTGNTSYTTSFFNNDTFSYYSQIDKKAKFKHKIPFQIAAGSAYRNSRWEIEADILVHGGIEQYTMFKSTVPVQIYNTIINSSEIITETIDIPSLAYSSKYVVNGAVGTRIRLFENFRVHAGLFTDFSPLDSSSKIFQEIDMYGGTLGLSLTYNTIAGGFGVRGSYGKSDQIQIRNRLSDDQFFTRLNITNFAFIWSLALRL